MRPFITFIILTLCYLSSSAQNPLFLGFDYQYDGVKSWLQNYDQVRWVSQEVNQRIVIEHNQATVTYLFNQGQLYQIDMSREFSSKKQGKEAFEGCLRYFKMIATNEVNFARGQGKHCKISEKNGKLYDLKLVPVESLDEALFQLKLSSRDPRLTPMAKREASDFELTIMKEQEALQWLQYALNDQAERYL